MPNNSKSPNNILGGIANISNVFTAAQQAKSARNRGQSKFDALARRGGLFGKAAQIIQAKKARQQNVPPVVSTAGASNMSGRIEGIESRLAALEGTNSATEPSQPAPVAPVETQAPLAGGQMDNVVPSDPTMMSIAGGMSAPPRDTTQADELGALMASPFTLRQRANMGPLNLNSPLKGNAFGLAMQKTGGDYEAAKKLLENK